MKRRVMFDVVVGDREVYCSHVLFDEVCSVVICDVVRSVATCSVMWWFVMV